MFHSPNEVVRLRPKMYVGDVAAPESMRALVKDALSFAIDQFVRGVAGSIDVAVMRDELTVSDDGPGIPLNDEARWRGFLSSMMVAAPFPEWSTWHERLSLAGWGVLNALGAEFWVETRNETSVGTFLFRAGFPVSSRIGPAAATTGTSLRWRPDRSILTSPLTLDVVKTLLADHANQLSGCQIGLHA